MVGDFLRDYGLKESYISFLEKVALKIVKFALDVNWYIAKPWIPDRFDDELKGIAEGSNYSYKDLRRINMFPELT